MPSKVISGSTKVVDFGTNRKRVFDFLLVINSNLCRISHLSEILWLIPQKSPIRTHPTLIQCLLRVNPLNFVMSVISPETRMMGLPCGEEIMIVGRTMWTQSMSVTDRQTDRQTDRITIAKTVQSIASHGKKYEKSDMCNTSGYIEGDIIWHHFCMP